MEPKLEKKPDPKAPAKPAPKKGAKEKQSAAGLLKNFNKVSGLIVKFQTPVIAIIIFVLLALTALRMMQYANPPLDDAKVQENLAKFKGVRIDEKAVERIKQLNDPQVSTSPNIKDNRVNPFAE